MGQIGKTSVGVASIATSVDVARSRQRSVRGQALRSASHAQEETMEFADLVNRFAAAAVAGDGDTLADFFTPDGTYDDYFFGPSTGRETIKKMLAHFADGGRAFRWEFFAPALSGDTGYASYRFSFESKRPEARGARVTFDGIGRFDLEGGRI